MFELLQLLDNYDDSGRLLMMSTAHLTECHYSPLATFGFALVLGIPLFNVFSEIFETPLHRFDAYSAPFCVTLNLFDGQ